mgnify:CR=1 FL=1
MNKVVIELQNIKRNFQVGDETVHALRGVSFTIREGEFVTIMGTSGSGKSTLLNTLGCLDTPTSGEYLLDGEPVNLTPKEYDILRFLMQNPGKVFSRVDLMEQVWNYGYVGDDARTVDVTVRRLREKIEDNPAAPAYILTRRGVGYYFSAQA